MGSQADLTGQWQTPRIRVVHKTNSDVLHGTLHTHVHTRMTIPPWKPRVHGRRLAECDMVSRADTYHHLGSHTRGVALRRGVTRHCFSCRPIQDATRWQTGTCQHRRSAQADERGNASSCSLSRGPELLTSTCSPLVSPSGRTRKCKHMFTAQRAGATY